MRDGVEARHRLGDDFEQEPAVIAILEDGLATIAAGSDVIEAVGEFDAQRARHCPA